MWSELTAGISTLAAAAFGVGWRRSRRRLDESRRERQDLANSSLVVEEERRLLELMASGASLTQVLDTLTRAIERIAPGARCTVMLLDREQRRFLLKGSGPSVPDEYLQAIDGLEIGPDVGACGSAAFRNETVVVEDISTDSRFAQAKDFVMSYGLRSCWSVPVRDSRGDVLGTFAMYHGYPTKPRPEELRMTRAAAQLAGNAIERARAEQALRDATHRLNLAERVARFGILSVDFVDSSVTISEGLAAMMERKGAPLRLSLEEFSALVHPDDRDALRETARRVGADGETVQNEFRLMLPSGAVRWQRSRLLFEVVDGQLKRATGAWIDITEEKDLLGRLQAARTVAEDAARAARAAERLEQDRKSILELVAKDRPLDQIATAIAGAVANHFPGSACSIQIELPDASHISVSPRLPEYLANALGRIPVASMKETPAERPIASLSSDPRWLHCLEAGGDLPFQRYRAVSIRRNALVAGSIILFSAAENPLAGPPFPSRGPAADGFAEDKALESWGQFASLAVERRGLYEQLSYRAQYDSLTKLLNRASLYERLDAQIARSARESSSMAVVYFDLDNFKEINDRHGHGVGDMVLRNVSRHILQSVRRTDMAARIGGDEFVLILPGVGDRQEASRVGDLIVGALGQPGLINGRELKVGASFGIGIFPDDGNHADTLLRIADEDMYRMKMSRRIPNQRHNGAAPALFISAR